MSTVPARLSNLDRHGKHVRRGLVLTDPMGRRLRVERVRMGHAICTPLDPWGRPRAGISNVVCESCTVVA